MVAIYVTPEAEGMPLAVSEVEAVAGKGLQGDRYFLGTGSFSDMPGTGRELTLLESEVIDDFDLDFDAGLLRRNVITAGVDLTALTGRRFRIGDVVVEGMRPALPCKHLARLTDSRVLRLKERAGLRAEIVTGAMLRVDDAIIS